MASYHTYFFSSQKQGTTIVQNGHPDQRANQLNTDTTKNYDHQSKLEPFIILLLVVLYSSLCALASSLKPVTDATP